jgi:hypothetical protein
MIIGFTAVSSCGKSTITKAVAQKLAYPSLVDHDVHIRTFEMMEQNNKAPSTKYFPEMRPEDSVEFERTIFHARMKMESELLSENKNLVVDESPIDFINYCYLMCPQHSKIIEENELSLLIESWRDQLKNYDYLFLLPQGVFPIFDDKRRHTNPHLLKHWDNALRSVWLDHKTNHKPNYPKFIEIPHFLLELDDRVNFVLRAVGK